MMTLHTGDWHDAQMADAERLDTLLNLAAPLITARFGNSAGDLVRAMRAGAKAAKAAAIGHDMDCEIEDEALELMAAAEALAEEWRANMGDDQ